MINTKQIPFFDYVVSEENFNEVESYHNFNFVVEKKENCFEIHFVNNIPANMHYYVFNGKYSYCINEELLADYIKDKGVELTINDNWQQYQNMKKKYDGMLKHNKYNEIQRISLYDKLTVYVDHFDVIKITDLFSINLNDAGNIIHNWIEKYEKLISEHQSHLCVELSSGLDTRSLAHFWKDDKIYNIYTKNDPDEIPIVQQLCAKYFPNAKLVIGVKENNNEIITLSGKGADMFVINGRKADPSFYKNNICNNNFKHLVKSICPYLDRDLARINPNGTNFKVIMQYLLVPEYMDIPYKSFARVPFIFTEEMREAAYEVIKHWGFTI